VIKYESDGMPAWTNRYTSFETNDVYPTELAVDNSGGAYVKQWVIYWGTSGLGTPVESVIAKYDALGNVVWSKHYPESAPGSGQGLQSVGPMALDDAGNLFVAGTAGRVLYNPGNLIVKFAGDGTALWTNQHPSQLMHDIDLLSVDRQGNAIVTGSRWSNAMTDYVVMQCSKDGVLLWTNVLSGPTYNGGNVPQTVPEVAGNVFVIGGSPGASPGLYQILKVSSNGVPLWTNQTINFGSTNGMIQGSAVDSAGNLYLLGNAPAPGSDYPDYVILKYSGDGQPLWTNRFNGAANRDDFAVALGVDGAGNVYVTGTSESQAGQRDFATAKYADLLFYSPPEDFTGSDTITCTLTDNFGNHATGRVEVLVMPGSFQFSLSPASTKLTPAGMELQVEGVPGTNAVVLEASTDLVSWQRILTNAPDHGSVQFLDPAAVSLPQRFYRAIQEQ